jgi:hypothetical protein
MSLIGRQIQWDKHCFVYCGRERCDCGASASPLEEAEYEEHKKRIELLSKTLELSNKINEALNKGKDSGED